MYIMKWFFPLQKGMMFSYIYSRATYSLKKLHHLETCTITVTYKCFELYSRMSAAVANMLQNLWNDRSSNSVSNMLTRSLTAEIYIFRIQQRSFSKGFNVHNNYNYLYALYT